ncbi:NodT family efflux transporter outer membrane factor (OMF) lipoprotein [Variovorax boronicumulans]|uniref:efflux transporter outer membrane subunit n=1 Tax=Variovorax boronicumulans TaxID=436515 RepID=UPI00278770D0|nr:efflux transporter outer membrane subunit [Variovorax boronicumulans]MDQ0073683.1 NodT family efflux transporter outer membrane factor (OMF) lipoprotein [Variovorax boronicumulans]
MQKIQMRWLRRLSPVTWVGALCLAGCAAPADLPLHAVELPASWQRTQLDANASTVDARWWSHLGSTELDALIAQAQARNQDLAMALARVDGARAQARIAGAQRLPELTGQIDASRQGRMGGQAAVDGNAHAIGFAARYELDLWGRQGALHREAQQGLRASVFERDAVQLSVTAEVASSWLQMVGLRERVAIARSNLENAQRVLRLVESRGRAGAATPLDLAQQRGLAAARERELARLQQQARHAETALSLLLGLPAPEPTATSAAERTRLEALRISPISAGLPSQLLVRRPDLAQAEARLAAADANVRAARAAMLPRVTLTASVGLQGQAPGGLFDNPIYSLAAGLAAPIFDGGRLAGERDLAEARRGELLGAYRAAIIGAFADAQTALDAVAGSDAQASAQVEELLQARRAAELSELRYRAGAETLLVLLDAQRVLYSAQDLDVQLRQGRLQARVALYRALGGGWRDEAGVLAQGER